MAASPWTPESELPFLASGGQMGALIMGKDWSGTELGPPAQWPATLRVGVGIVLSSQFPMFLAWGPQLALLYNDAYIPVLGTKHPDALGRPFQQVWHELRPVIEPLISAVLANEATYQEDLLLVRQRSGPAEETYFTFSYSPILSTEGPPLGLFCAGTDTTARVIGARRLRTLRELGEISAPGAPSAHQALSATLEVLAGNRADVPHAAAYLLDDDRCAARLVSSYGLAPGSVALPSTLPHPDADPAIWRALAGGAPELATGLSGRYASAFLGDAGPAGNDVPDAAMVLPITPAGAESPVAVLVAAVSPYRELDADYRTFYELLTQQLATAVGGRLDIDARHRDRGRQRLLAVIGSALDRATTAQARREVLVRALVAEGLVDVARLIEIDEDGHQVVHAMAANTAAAQRLLAQIDGTSTLAREVAASGEPRLVEVDDIYLAESSPDPAQQNLRRRLDMRTAILVPLATRGRVVGLLTTARTGTSPAQTTDDLAVLTEIGHRAATALDNALLFERLEVLQRATAALSAAATPVQVAETLVTQFEQLLGTLSVAVFELDESDTLYAMTLRGWNDAVQRDWRSLPLDAPVPVAAAARHRKPVWVERAVDWQRDFPYLLPLAREYGCVSLCCLPLLAGGRCLGVVGFGFSTQRVLDPAERTAVMALVDQGAQALQRAGLLDAESQARRAAEELSQVVGALSGAVTPAEVTRVILEHAAELGASAAVVVLRSGDQLDVLAATAATGDGVFLDGVPLDAAHPLAYATRTGEPVWHGARSERAWRDRSLSSDGDAGLPAQVAVPLLLGSHPIGAVGLHFADGPPVLSAGERAVILTAASQCAQALERARLHQAEREVAEVLQRSLLPRELPGLARLAAAARYLPGVAGVQAGGDWYDLLPIGGTRIAIAVGDVVGQGPLAAAVMGQLRSALACYLLEGHSPAAALERLDRFATHVEGAQCSTCACLTMDWDSGELCWSRAGHLPILLLGTGGPRYLDAGAGTALGVSGRPPYTEARTAIAPGASVLLYTDGLIERRNEVIDDGMDRLARAAAELTDRAPEGFATGLVARVLGDTVPADDIALVVVRFIPEPLRGRLAAEPAALGVLRRAVAHWAATAGLPAAMTEDLQFALGEAAANAVEHAYPDGDGHDNDGAFDYEVSRLASGAIRVRVQDYGTWRSEPADNGFRGHGLKIIRAVADRVEVNGGATGTEVRFLLPAAQPTEAATGWAARSPARSPAGPPGQPATLTMPTPGDSPEARTLQLRGDLDLHGVATVRNALLAELSSPGEVVMDLRQAGYLSSAGVGLLAEAAATSQRRGIQLSVLLTPGSSAARIITLTGLDGSLTVRLDR